MTIYLNDLSLIGGRGLLKDWDVFNAFNKLVDNLIRMGQVTLVAPVDLWYKPLGGVNVLSKTNSDGTRLPADQGKLIYEVYRKFKLKTHGEPFFSEDEDLTVISSSVGKAAECGDPVISIAFDSRYAKDKLQGWLKQTEKDAVVAEVNNFFGGSKKYLTFITDLTKCRLLNPQKEPLWNHDVVDEILKGVDFIGGSKDEKREKFINYGRKVLECNGWIFNSRVSALNSSEKKKRIVYDSRRMFTSTPISYLCIDLEGPDLCFELCDRRGNHLGEVDRNGVVSDPQQHHNIKV